MVSRLWVVGSSSKSHTRGVAQDVTKGLLLGKISPVPEGEAVQSANLKLQTLACALQTSF